MPGCPLVFANSVLLLFVSSQLCWTAGILTRKHHKFLALVRIRRLRLRPTSKSVNHKSPCRENPSVREILNAKGPGAGRRVKVEVPQDFSHVFIESHNGNRFGFHPLVADDVVVPIHILRLQKRQIGLRRAQVPRQFVERLAFGIIFAGDDGQMFRQRDAALLLELDGRPAFLGQHRPRQPRHVQGKVLDASQVDRGRNFFRFQHTQEMFRARFQNR